MTKSVLILGCGPAALFCAKAVEDAGFHPMIFSKKRKSEMYGAQYLHGPIPDVSPERGFTVRYSLLGSLEGYRDKVYGAGFRGNLSPEDLQPEHDAWDIRQAYNDLWSHFQERIQNIDFASPQEAVAWVSNVGSDYHSVVSTIPAPMLCHNPGHVFQAEKIYAIGDAPERGVFSPIVTPLNEVVCSGWVEDSWYRKSNILGYNTVEWSGKRPKPPLEGVADVLKPIGTTCDCLSWVHRLGRYGKWTKGVLSHEAYYETRVGLSEG